VSAQEVTDTIALDPTLAAKILRFVNSPMAGVSRQVGSLKQAVSLMGMRGVKMMALSFSVLSSSKQSSCAGFDGEHFALYSLGCGVCAKHLAAMSPTNGPQDAFSTALLSQLGRSIFAASLPDEYAHVLAAAKRVPLDLPPLERAAFGETYASVGEQVLRSWGLPEALCQAIGMFRSLEEQPDAPDLAKLIFVAERAADVICPGHHGEPVDPTNLVDAANRLLGVGEQVCAASLCAIAAEVENMRALLEIPKGNLRPTDQIEAEVRERIAELSMAMHLENQCMAQQQEELLHRATTDALTRVGNRAAFDSRLALELERAARSGEPLTLMMIDVDRFKLVNDAHGHPAGDCVLQAVARVLDESVRKVDYVARYGGEEFAVIAPTTEAGAAVQLAERLRGAVEQTRVPWSNSTLRVTISVGVALAIDPSGASDAPKLIKRADEQLYFAKNAGRNRVKSTSGVPNLVGAAT